MGGRYLAHRKCCKGPTSRGSQGISLATLSHGPSHKTWLLNPHNQPTARSVTCLTSLPPSPSPPTPSPLLRTPSPPSPSTSPPSPCPAYSALEVTDQHITEQQK